MMEQAALLLTGCNSLYKKRRDQQTNIHSVSRRVVVVLFAQARRIVVDPPDQAAIPHPRLGFFGVVDERMDLDLLAGLADARPAWQLVVVGPVAKIDPASLPRRPNIHYLGPRPYEALPDYLGGWDVAIMPFARNEATRFISPTKTLEYLAAGRPVVSTSIRDVVQPYGNQGLVHIADDPAAFAQAAER